MGNASSYSTIVNVKISPFLELLGIKKPVFRIIIYGLDNSGKTTMLYRYIFNETVTTIPTVGFNVESIDIKNIKLVCWDVGLRDKARPLIRHYLKNTQALVYVIDSNDRERIDEAKEELDHVKSNEELNNQILLVIANKQDISTAMSVDEIKEKLELHKITTFRSIGIIGTVATTGQGLNDCLNWLYAALTDKNFKRPIVETSQDISYLTRSLNSTGYLSLLKHKFWSLFGYSKPGNNEIV